MNPIKERITRIGKFFDRCWIPRTKEENDIVKEVRASLLPFIETMFKQQYRELNEAKDTAYWERNQLVAALSKLYPSWIGWHEGDNDDWDPEWKNVIYILLPTGQVSWHIHESELSSFSHLKKTHGPHWDGHTTEEKYRRLAALEQVK